MDDGWRIRPATVRLDEGGAVEKPDAFMATALATTSVKLKSKNLDLKVVTDLGLSSAVALDKEPVAGLGPSTALQRNLSSEYEVCVQAQSKASWSGRIKASLW